METQQETSILQSAVDYLATLVRLRLEHHFKGQESPVIWEAIGNMNWNGLFDHFRKALQLNKITTEECVLLLLGLAPHIKPHFFDEILRDHLPKAGDFPQLGGVRGKQHRGFLPTGETALFLLAGEDLEKRIHIQQLFDPDHHFYKRRILWIEEPPAGEPAMSGKLVLSREYVDLLTTGKVSRPRLGINFPAQFLQTEMDWEDLVLNVQTADKLEELKNWLRHNRTLMVEMGMRKKLKPGYRALFHGPPGTGKTLTATLLGKYFDRDVYKIDLSLIVSKYIGETEKNLSNLFDRAENKDWILFFDEADALFGKRTNVRDAHDKYANQEVSYLLQRVENYNGLVILASNLKSNIDEAFLRRFQSIVHFPMPTPTERLKIWQKGFPPGLSPADPSLLQVIARRYNLTGAHIMNVIQYCCLQALAGRHARVSPELLEQGIKREFAKEGKNF